MEQDQVRQQSVQSQINRMFESSHSTKARLQREAEEANLEMKGALLGPAKSIKFDAN